MPQPKQEPSEPKPATAGQMILYALGCYGAGALLFFIFYGIESSGSGATMPSWLVLLYNLGGKWLVAGVFAVLGTLCLIGAFVDFSKKDK